MINHLLCSSSNPALAVSPEVWESLESYFEKILFFYLDFDCISINNNIIVLSFPSISKLLPLREKCLCWEFFWSVFTRKTPNAETFHAVFNFETWGFLFEIGEDKSCGLLFDITEKNSPYVIYNLEAHCDYKISFKFLYSCYLKDKRSSCFW